MSETRAPPVLWRHDAEFVGDVLVAQVAHTTRGDSRYELVAYVLAQKPPAIGYEVFGPPRLMTLLSAGTASSFREAKTKAEMVLSQLTETSSNCGGPVPVDPRDR